MAVVCANETKVCDDSDFLPDCFSPEGKKSSLSLRYYKTPTCLSPRKAPNWGGGTVSKSYMALSLWTPLNRQKDLQHDPGHHHESGSCIECISDYSISVMSQSSILDLQITASPLFSANQRPALELCSGVADCMCLGEQEGTADFSDCDIHYEDRKFAEEDIHEHAAYNCSFDSCRSSPNTPSLSCGRGRKTRRKKPAAQNQSEDLPGTTGNERPSTSGKVKHDDRNQRMPSASLKQKSNHGRPQITIVPKLSSEKSKCTKSQTTNKKSRIGPETKFKAQGLRESVFQRMMDLMTRFFCGSRYLHMQTPSSWSSFPTSNWFTRDRKLVLSYKATRCYTGDIKMSDDMPEKKGRQRNVILGEYFKVTCPPVDNNIKKKEETEINRNKQLQTFPIARVV